MKTEGRIFLICGGVLALATVAYALLTKNMSAHSGPNGAIPGSIEWVGVLGLALSALLALMVGFYFTLTAGRLAAPRPEDRSDADIAEGAGKYGFFSPYSWWPMWVAGAAATAALGLATRQWWLMVLGLVLVIVTAIGFVFEYYRAPHTQARG